MMHMKKLLSREGDMTDLILQHFGKVTRRRLAQILSAERRKMFSERKPIVKKEGGQSPTLKTIKSKKDNV